MKSSFKLKQHAFYLWTGLAYFLLWVIASLHSYPDQFFERLLNDIWRTIYVIVINFIFFEYTLVFLKRKRPVLLQILLWIVIIWLYFIVLSFGLYCWRYIGIVLHIYTPIVLDYDEEHMITVQAGFGIPSLIFFTVIKHIYDYRKLIATAQKLRIEKQEAELSYLKSQTNPHFLFNTLNNIYSLARDKADLAPESILRLSKILRFMLYETSGAFIAIEQELKIISDYIELEKLRYDDSLHINLNHNIEDMKQALPPLLLIPLVENAFKHGVSETRNQPFVDIHLSVNKRQLTFIVKNSSESFPADGGVKENIGLSNLRRQLELLYTDYDLSLNQTGSVFIATLKINLASHV